MPTSHKNTRWYTLNSRRKENGRTKKARRKNSNDECGSFLATGVGIFSYEGRVHAKKKEARL